MIYALFFTVFDFFTKIIWIYAIIFVYLSPNLCNIHSITKEPL